MTKTNRNLILIITAISVILIGIALLFPAEDKPPGPKNIIYLIGDGMGFGQVSTLIMERAVNREASSSSQISRITHMGMVTTHSADSKVTDSAAGGTALATGEKTNNGTVGLNASGDTLTSIMVHAREMGKSTGIVVNTAILDATPAAFYAHVEKRSLWDEIAVQLTKSDYDILIGNGLEHFNSREDSLDLISVFTGKGYDFSDSWEIAAALDNSGKLVVLTSVRMVFPEAVAKALDLLDKKNNPEGFFLMIEEARIDGHGHNNDVQGLIDEMEIMDRVMQVVLDYADAHPETLVVITADHETGGVNIGYDGRPYFSTAGHSGSVVPVFAYGPGAEQFAGLMDNTDIPARILSLIE
ncbi:MAG: alkaline phosphatase [Bacteroidales bacterium]|nr:alkaline phosphatase [Bacteroidales bacterium]